VLTQQKYQTMVPQTQTQARTSTSLLHHFLDRLLGGEKSSSSLSLADSNSIGVVDNTNPAKIINKAQQKQQQQQRNKKSENGQRKVAALLARKGIAISMSTDSSSSEGGDSTGTQEIENEMHAKAWAPAIIPKKHTYMQKCTTLTSVESDEETASTSSTTSTRSDDETTLTYTSSSQNDSNSSKSVRLSTLTASEVDLFVLMPPPASSQLLCDSKPKPRSALRKSKGDRQPDERTQLFVRWSETVRSYYSK
jgi:uncharacterized protein YccT (UPF0319 family)